MSASNPSNIWQAANAGLTLRQRLENQRAWDSRGTITELDNIGPPRWNMPIEELSDDVLLGNFRFLSG